MDQVMFLVYETLLNNYSEIPQGYGDENCCIVTGYPKQICRKDQWSHISFEHLVYPRHLIFEIHAPNEEPKNVNLIPETNFNPTNVAFSYIDRLEKYQKWPYVEIPRDFNWVPSRLEALDSEFCFSYCFHPDWIDEVCHAGFFPMAIQVNEKNKTYISAHKLSFKRCVMRPKDLKMVSRTRKRAKNYTFSCDKSYGEVVKLCVELKGENWLCPLLQKSFIYLHQNKSKYRAKFHSMEVWDGDTLIAGELGYVVGGIYTSLTGGSKVSSVGTVQLCLTGKLLEQLDFLWWDFEMSHKYKLDLGAKEVPRKEWLVEYYKCRSESRELVCDNIIAKEVLTGTVWRDDLLMCRNSSKISEEKK